MLKEIRFYLSKGCRAQWCIFGLFTSIIFIKCVLFHWFCFQSILISSLWKEPLEFFAFWLPKLNIAILLASFIFIFSNKWWTIVIALLVDLWSVSNLIYFRANELLITYESFMMITNLKGFESSITMYWNFQCTSFLILTILYCFLLHFIPKLKSRRFYIWIFIFAIVCVLRASTQICRYFYADNLGFVMSNVKNINKTSYIKNVIPYREVVAGVKESTYFTGSVSHKNAASYYLRYHSIITYFPRIFIAYVTEQQALKELQELGKIIEMQKIEKIDLFLHEHNKEREIAPTFNLIVLIVESFESWLIGATDEKNQLIMPHITNFTKAKANIYCSNIKSQVREGVSGDGQMLINTGILPLQRGSAALLFGNNIYPNWAHFFSRSATIYPGEGTEWNQDTMTVRYHYQCQINPKEGRWEDETTMSNLLTWVDTIAEEPFACQTITVSTHTPFVYHQTSKLYFSDDTPRDLQKYLNCFHYTDSCLGKTFEEFERKGIFKNTIIVITGDHTIFKSSMLKDFESYAREQDLTIASGENYCPLIIYSPQIQENIQITDVCYQMDIYPTILHLIGCEDYYWKGFGVNLLDSTARHNRPITEKEAYELSDKIIRSNYFSTYSN